MESCKYKEVFHKEVLGEQFSWKILFRQLFVSSVVWTTFFTIGMYLAAPTVIIPALRRAANATDESDALASFISPGCSYFTIPWNFILPLLLATTGRKTTCLFVNSSLVFVSIIFYFSDTPSQLLVFEILTGLPHSGVVTVAGLIIPEYTSPKYRGVFLMINSASLHWGIWISNVLGTFHWRYISVLGFFCSLYTLTAFFWPESPFWLASKGRFRECKRSHRWLNGNRDTSKKELEDLLQHQSVESFKTQTVSVLRNLFETISSRDFYKPIIVVIFCVCVYMFSGKMLCIFYALDVFKRITLSESAAYKSMLIFDGASVVSMYIGCFLCTILKRRTLLLYSAAVSILFLIILSLYLSLVNLSVLTEKMFISISLLGLNSFAVGCGPTIMATALYAELIPLKHKSLSVVLISIMFILLQALSINISPFVYKLGMHGAFFFYAICMSFFTILLYKYLPETKDITLVEIDEYFKGAEMKRLLNRNLI